MASQEACRALRSLIPTTPRSCLLRQQRNCFTSARRTAARDAAQTRHLRPRSLQSLPQDGQRAGIRPMATLTKHNPTSVDRKGPIPEYDARVQSGRLREDEHQRGLIASLQDLHNTLAGYTPDPVIRPTIESLQPKKPSFLSSLFGAGGESSQVKMHPPENLPKGLYMYGDVGSGKTMLMDLFFDTLPSNIIHRTRIHFHNFMQDVHKQLHKMKAQHGSSLDCIPFVAAEIAEKSTVLCFDEFQCTDVADAMILRRLMESLMAHGVVLVTTSNRHPTELYKNGIQRESFIPCINLLMDQLQILNLDSTTDYRKIPRPPSGVYHHPLNEAAKRHAERWFKFLGDFQNDPPHQEIQHVWGRPIVVPRASGKACWFNFNELLGGATGAADYLELVQHYQAFIITGVPGMNYRSRDLARRFITFLDAIYESRAKLVLTTEVPLTQLFMAQNEIKEMITSAADADGPHSEATKQVKEGAGVDDAMRSLMDDLGMNMDTLKKSSMFSGDEEAFAFARALSRLTEMGSQEWVERGLGMGASGQKDAEDWKKVRGSWRQDSY